MGDANKVKQVELMPMRSMTFVLISSTLWISLMGCIFPAYAQCPIDTITLKGRVEGTPQGSIVRVQLYYPKVKLGELGETTIEDGRFAIPIKFVTQSRRPILTNLPAKCDRKPTTVVITLVHGDQEYDRASLEFPADFKVEDPRVYVSRTEVVLNGIR